MPLDLVTNNEGRQAPTLHRYHGIVSESIARQLNAAIELFLGTDQSNISPLLSMRQACREPPWIAVSSHYANFVRSRQILPELGRLLSVSADMAHITSPKGESQPFSDVAAV